MARRKKEPPKDSIRVTLGEIGRVWTADQMKAMVIEAIDEAVGLGLTRFGRANLYLKPVDEKGGPVVRIGKRKLEDIAIAHPYRTLAEEHGL